MDSLPTSERLARLQADLKIDRALGVGAVFRFYGLARSQVQQAGIPIRDIRIGLHHRSPLDDFAVVVSEDAQALSSQQLRHLAGTSATRLVLGASVTSWENLADRVGDASKPDALWRSSQGLVAIEFDAGSYNPIQVETKLKAFSSFKGGQVWSTSLQSRLVALKQRMADVKDAKAMLVDWQTPIEHF